MTTPNPLTPAELDHLRKLDAERTPGEWRVANHLRLPWVETCGNSVYMVVVPGEWVAEKHAVCAFIAACSTAVPRLLAHIDALNERVRELEGLVKKILDDDADYDAEAVESLAESDNYGDVATAASKRTNHYYAEMIRAALNKENDNAE